MSLKSNVNDIDHSFMIVCMNLFLIEENVFLDRLKRVTNVADFQKKNPDLTILGNYYFYCKDLNVFNFLMQRQSMHHLNRHLI